MEIPPPAPIIEGDIIDKPIEDEPIIDQTDSEGPLDSPPREKRCPIFETPIEANDEIVHDDNNDSIVPYEEDFSMLKLLEPLNEILLDFSGVCGVISDEFETVSNYLQEKDEVCIKLPNIIDDRVVDYLICIPPLKIQITTLVSAIARGIPFFLYLPFRIFNIFTIDTSVCRLNMIIMKDYTPEKSRRISLRGPSSLSMEKSSSYGTIESLSSSWTISSLASIGVSKIGHLFS